jgi:hypothetical protein
MKIERGEWPWMSSALHLTKRKTEHASREWGHGAGMSATQGRTCRPFAQFLEHVVCMKPFELEAVFGLAMGQTGLWA